jgi:hypothetical protein
MRSCSVTSMTAGIRANRVVLGLGYYEQRAPQEGPLRPTTLEEKQALLCMKSCT